MTVLGIVTQSSALLHKKNFYLDRYNYALI